MAAIGGLLFGVGFQGPSLDQALRHQSSVVVGQLVDKLPAAVFSTKTDEQLLEQLKKEAGVEPLALQLDAAKPDATEIKLEHVNGFGERFFASGLRISKAIPFTGDPMLWKLSPDTFDLNPPRGEVQGKRVLIGMDVPTASAQQAVDYIKETIGKIETYAASQKRQLEPFNGSVAGLLKPRLEARRRQLMVAADVLKKLA